MNKWLSGRLGRLRLIAFAEGLSLLVLVLIAVPLKYWQHNPAAVRAIGPVHGLLFLLFVVNTLGVAVEYGWKFRTTTWKVLLACIIPFGTFYIDHRILKPMAAAEAGSKPSSPA